MPRIRIHSSTYDTPGEVVAVEHGEIVWAGPIDCLEEAGSFDAVFCHDDDEEALTAFLRALSFEAAPR